MHPYLTRFDRELALIVSKLPDAVRPLMLTASFIGQPIIVIATAIAIGLGGVIRGSRPLVYASVGTLVAFGGNTTIKHIVHRARPETLYVGGMRIHSYSFPSGHAFGSTVVFGLLAYLAYQHLSHPWHVITTAAIVILIVTIGISRVYLGAHFPSDVIAGWLLGSLSLFLIIKFLHP
ncbi:phosphatase PAP2 family protein [Polaromonas sp.]|nr:phosphatase PAP2 family protein [Candidatus Saccharibacteria bacterium]